MADLRTLGATSNRVRFTLKDKTTGQGKTGLSISTTGLVISTIADNEASATAYTQAGSTIETIATLGTFATPTSTKCRFKAVDATNHPGLYEFQFANARFAVSSAKRLVISVNDAESTILDADYEIEFTADLVSAVWDEINTGATHNLANSTGKQLRTVTSGSTDAIYPLSGTVNLTAATSTTATLDLLASNGSQAYQWNVLNILTGTGAGQSRVITNYTTGRVATVSLAFSPTPDATSTFDITPTASVQVVSYIVGQDPATLVWAAASRTLTALGTDIISAASVSAGAVTKIQAGLASSGGTVDANLISVNGTTFAGANVPCVLADGVAHGGTPGSSTATMAMRAVNVTNPSGDAISAISSNHNGMLCRGGGFFSGLSLLGGSSGGNGLNVVGAGSGGAGAFFTGSGAAAVSLAGDPDAPTLQILGAVTQQAIYIGTDGADAINIDPGSSGVWRTSTPGHAVSILATGAGKKALLLAGDAAIDALAIAAGTGSPIPVFDAQARVTGSATLLDATPVTDPGGVASTFPQMLVQVWRYCFKRKTKTVSGLTIKTYADNNTTVNTTQSYTDDGAGNQSQGPAS